MAIGSGYNFRGWFTNDEYSLTFSFLGKNTDGSYGWFDTYGATGITYTNVSFVVITSAHTSNEYYFESITQNALYTLDGTAINNHSSIVNAVGKLCYLVKDCDMKWLD